MNTILVKAIMADSKLSSELTKALGEQEVFLGHDSHFLVKTDNTVTEEYLDKVINAIENLPEFDSGGGVMTKFINVTAIPLLEGDNIFMPPEGCDC